MGMLDRYHKTGGFLQLVQLIETCDAAKKEKFLGIIQQEDAVWAEAVEKKILTLDRIFSWSDEVLAEIIGNLNELTLAVIIHGFTGDRRERFEKQLSFAQKRRIEGVAANPTQGEVASMVMKMIAETRKMICDNRIRLDKIAPEMFIEEGIEEHLKKATKSKTEDTPQESSTSDGSGPALRFELPDKSQSTLTAAQKDELSQLRKQVMSLAHENANLRHEVHVLREKLEQIRRIA